MVDDALRAPIPVEFERGLIQGPRRGRVDAFGLDAERGLRRTRQGAARGQREDLCEHPRAERREAVVEFAVGLIGADRARALQHDVAGIESGIHEHDGHAAPAHAVAQLRLQRRRAAIERQQARMHVERAEAWQVEHRLRHDLSVRSERKDVGRARAQRIDRLA